MSYTVTFWAFAKKSNSTKIPSTAGTQYTCEVVDTSGILNPTIKLHTNFTDPSSWTYARITQFNRYYFISNWRYDRGLWWADLMEDVLASYKTQIGDLNMYVLRSAAASNGKIVDTRYPIIAGTAHDDAQNNSNPFAESVGNGYFVVGILNNDLGAVGVVSYYVFDSAEFRHFADFLLGDSSYLDQPAEISDELLKCLVNPTQYIVSCIWLPVQPPVGSTVSDIPVGWWTLSGVSASHLSGYSRTSGSVSVTVPKHPDAAARGAYLLQEPYSTYYLDFPPFGSFTIPANALVDETSLDLYWDVDCISGMGRLRVLGGPTGHRGTITIINAQIGVPVALAQNAPDLGAVIQQSIENSTGYQPSGGRTQLGRAINNLYSAAAQKLSGAGETISDIANAYVASRLPVQVLGGNGGFMSGYYPIKLTLTYAKIAPDNTAEWGKPLCEVRTLKTLSGYILCADTDFEISCTAAERDAIGAALTGGFFYE